MTTPVTLVTGAASGIGLAIAQHLARGGDRVLMTDISPGVQQPSNSLTRRSSPTG